MFKTGSPCYRAIHWGVAQNAQLSGPCIRSVLEFLLGSSLEFPDWTLMVSMFATLGFTQSEGLHQLKCGSCVSSVRQTRSHKPLTLSWSILKAPGVLSTYTGHTSSNHTAT